MLRKGDKVVYEGVDTTCVSDEFQFFGTGPLVVELEHFSGWVNAKLPRKNSVEELINKIRDLHQMDIYTVDENWCIQLFELHVAANDMIGCIYEDSSKSLHEVLSKAWQWALDRVRQSN